MSDMMTQKEAMNMSNEQAVQILISMRNMMCDRYGCPISDAAFALDKAIEALSADKPQGEWIVQFPYEDTGKTRTCSNCNITQTVNVYKGVVRFKFCPYCGMKMKGAGNEHDK